jgi:hypothetical protein
MATPQQLYRGTAPAAMTKMGDGMADAYARVGAIEGAGYAKLGESIGGALQAVGGMYADYKKDKAIVSAQSKALDTFKPYLPKDMATTLTNQWDNMNNSDTSLAEKKEWLHSTMGMAGNAVAQQFKMQQIGAEQGGATGRTIISENAATGRNDAALQSAMEKTRYDAQINTYNNAGVNTLQRGSAFAPATLRIGTRVGGGLYDSP